MIRAARWMVAAAVIGCGSGFTIATAAEYPLTGDNTKIEFVGTKPEGKHTGSFPKLTGTFDLTEDITKSKISVKIDMEALESDDPKLTGHMKAPDFFETKKYPDARFVSKSITAKDDGYVATGDLTMHGKTKSISFPAKIFKTGGSANLTSDFSINRSDWGISYGAGKIDEVVKLTIKLKAQ